MHLLRHCAEMLERCFGPEDIDTLTVKHNLASKLRGVDPAAARKLHLEDMKPGCGCSGPTTSTPCFPSIPSWQTMSCHRRTTMRSR